EGLGLGLARVNAVDQQVDLPVAPARRHLDGRDDCDPLVRAARDRLWHGIHGVMVGHGDDLEAAPGQVLDQCLRRPFAIGRARVHVEIDRRVRREQIVRVVVHTSPRFLPHTVYPRRPVSGRRCGWHNTMTATRGGDGVASRADLIAYCRERLEPERYRDVAANGLQVEGAAEVERLAVAVSTSAHTIGQAAEWGAQAMLVHHGLLWGGGLQPLTGILGGRLRELFTHDINLIAYHLPLDGHPEIGNNALL